jgi:hypothetical protein
MHFAPQHDELLPQRSILGFKPALGLEERGHRVGPGKLARSSPPDCCDSLTGTMRMTFSVHTGEMADASFRATEAGLICVALRCWHEDAGAKFYHQFWAAASGCAWSVLRLVLEICQQLRRRSDMTQGKRAH